jgi:glutathione S-transferase
LTQCAGSAFVQAENASEAAPMLTLVHSPQSRSTRILWMLEETGLPYDVRYVTISRQDGSGGPDANNPHPAKKVPVLIHDGRPIIESSAILIHLADMAPQTGLLPPIGTAARGEALAWVATYAATYEPILMAQFAGVGDNPMLRRNIGAPETVHAMLRDALDKSPYLSGEAFTIADMMFADAAAWFRDLLPPGEAFDAYIARCTQRPARDRAMAKDAKPG